MKMRSPPGLESTHVVDLARKGFICYGIQKSISTWNRNEGSTHSKVDHIPTFHCELWSSWAEEQFRWGIWLGSENEKSMSLILSGGPPHIPKRRKIWVGLPFSHQNQLEKKEPFLSSLSSNYLVSGFLIPLSDVCCLRYLRQEDLVSWVSLLPSSLEEKPDQDSPVQSGGGVSLRFAVEP